jgi:predicted lipid-binding transport protein (Tim44 family)
MEVKGLFWLFFPPGHFGQQQFFIYRLFISLIGQKPAIAD